MTSVSFVVGQLPPVCFICFIISFLWLRNFYSEHTGIFCCNLFLTDGKKALVTARFLYSSTAVATYENRSYTTIQQRQKTDSSNGKQTLSEVNMCHYDSPHFFEKYFGLGCMKRPTHSLFLLPVSLVLMRRSPEYGSEARGLWNIPEFIIPCYKHATIHIHLLRSPEPLTTEHMQRATLQSGCHPSDSCMKDGRWLSLAGQATSITGYDAWTNLAVTLSGSLSKR